MRSPYSKVQNTENVYNSVIVLWQINRKYTVDILHYSIIKAFFHQKKNCMKDI